MPLSSWPDFEIKVGKNIPKCAHKGATDVSSYKVSLLMQPKKLPKIWATLTENLAQKELSKIAQSGHTAPGLPRTKYRSVYL